MCSDTGRWKGDGFKDFHDKCGQILNIHHMFVLL